MNEVKNALSFFRAYSVSCTMVEELCSNGSGIKVIIDHTLRRQDGDNLCPYTVETEKEFLYALTLLKNKVLKSVYVNSLTHRFTRIGGSSKHDLLEITYREGSDSFKLRASSPEDSVGVMKDIYVYESLTKSMYQGESLCKTLEYYFNLNEFSIDQFYPGGDYEHTNPNIVIYGMTSTGELLWPNTVAPLCLKELPNPYVNVNETQNETVNEKEPEMSKIKASAVAVAGKNKSAAITAAKLTAGRVAMKQIVKAIKPSTPMMARGYLETPVGQLVLANLFNFAMTQYMGDNKKAMIVADSLLEATMVDAMASLNIEEKLESILGKVDVSKLMPAED